MQSLRSSLLLASAVTLFLPHGADANAFLGKEAVARPQSRLDILEVLEEELGSGHGRADETRVARLQEELEHTFAALPRNGHGNLPAAGARYALHRLFVQRHAWQLTGLEPGGQGWSNSSAADALGDRVPSKVRRLFEERMDEEGVSLHELAVLAALLETMVHAETDDRLRIALSALGKRETDTLSKDAATSVIHAYMASYVLGVPLAELTPEGVRKHAQSVEKAYPTWPETQGFLDSVRDSVAGAAAAYDFGLLSAILERAGEQYGRWQSRECSALKATLSGMEARPGSGRVRLGDFYRSALSGEHWQFSESVDYLRQLGALDESEPGEPSVIIPNYIGSPSNCVASSGYYAVCCLDECEELMDGLERELRAPAASPGDIAKALAASRGGNGTLPAALRSRLEDVAAHHGGAVPLHGRLFAQWMHYAHPRECPFPHITGTTSPLRAEEFEARTGGQAAASKEEMRQFAEAAAPSRAAAEGPEDGLCSSMWTMEEELVDSATHKAHREARGAPEAAAPLRAAALVLAAVSLVVALAKTAAPALELGQAQDPKAKGAAVASAGGPRDGATYSV